MALREKDHRSAGFLVILCSSVSFVVAVPSTVVESLPLIWRLKIYVTVRAWSLERLSSWVELYGFVLEM